MPVVGQKMEVLKSGVNGITQKKKSGVSKETHTN